MQNKLQDRWKSHYRILEQKGPVTYLIKNQLDNSVVQVHADQIRLANIQEWPDRKVVSGYPKRRANFVVPPDDSSSSYDESEVSGAESANKKKLSKLPESLSRVRRQRESSSSEDNLPLAQLRKHLREQSKDNNPKLKSKRKSDTSSASGADDLSDDGMSINDSQLSERDTPTELYDRHKAISENPSYLNKMSSDESTVPSSEILDESGDAAANPLCQLPEINNQDDMIINAVDKETVLDTWKTEVRVPTVKATNDGNSETSEKQQYLQLVLAHMRESVKNNNALMQDLVKRLF